MSGELQLPSLLFILTCLLNCPVPEETAYPGTGGGGGEACHQTLLSAQRHQQRRIQRHPQESCPQGQPQHIQHIPAIRIH